ncbi:hypothetical protein CPLU01_13941, partial [Colletotrichum plurivorum]
NTHNRKRRRPFGCEDDSPTASAHQYFPPSSQSSFALFVEQPYCQHRTQIEEVAALYGYTGYELHQILSQSSHCRPRDGSEIGGRQRILTAYSMSSQFPGGSQAQDFSEKSNQHGHDGLVIGDAGQPSSGWPSDLTQGLSVRMANLFGQCSNCFGHCIVSIPEGYQLIHESNIMGYGTSTGYEVEKPPSAGLPQPEAYVPTTVPPTGTDSFPMADAGMMTTYAPNFQPVQESPSQGLAAPPAAPENMVYSADVPANSYYPSVSNAPAPTPDASHNFPNAAGHIVSTTDMVSAPYGDSMMAMDMTPTMQHQTPIPVTTAGYPMATPYAMQDMAVKDETVEQTPMPPGSSRLDIVYSHQRPPASKRGPFKDIKQRQETANTRKTGSCIRCRMQRIRCVPDPEDPSSACVTCKPKANSNKLVVRQPCMRAKITDVKCMKPGQVHGFEWTLRWGENGPVDNISTWASNVVKTIRVTEGYTSDMSLQLHVREFVPQPGDKLERSWVTTGGVKKSVPIPPYAITNLDEAQSAYQDYIQRAVVDCFTTVVEGVMGATRDRLLYATYRKAWEVSQDPRTAPEEQELLTQTLQMWMAVRLTTKSVEIVGHETLGMDNDILDESHPQHGSIPLPPVMGAQLDSVLIQHIQTRLRREMLEKLQKMVQANKQKTWLTTYLVTFILLHNVALLTDHDKSYAKKHGMLTTFARESDVREYHYGGTILLAYFHYCNKGVVPFTEECRDQDLRQLAQLDEKALQFVQWTRAQVMAHKREWNDLYLANRYEQPYFFVSQLFQREWKAQNWVGVEAN